ncbi:MAG: hypothetical protein LQ349_001019 [Xanthoria aureola]|nr:MAG: hypothetical protein LQ349_001019 [Xanthoria aureola]
MASRCSSLSPPPLKRRRVKAPIPSTSTATSNSQQPLLLPRIPPSPSQSTLIQGNLRIYAWNINGIAPYLDQQPLINTFFATKSSTRSSTPPSSQPSFRACLQRWSFPHIVCLQEVKIAPSDTSSQASVRRAVNSTISGHDPLTEPNRLYETQFNLPRDKHNATGFGRRVYGVCTLVRQDLAASSTTKSVDWDLEGRVLITELHHHGIVIFNIYAVNGTTNPYRDPNSGETVGDRHMRKRIFHTELRGECSRYESQGWHVVIAGDMNVSQTPMDSHPQLRIGKEHVTNRRHFADTFMKGKGEGGLGMRDSFREVHGQERKYSYRPPGKAWGEGMDRVDLILVSEGTRIKRADILDSELERGRSDHVPLWIEVEVKSAGDEVEADEKERTKSQAA